MCGIAGSYARDGERADIGLLLRMAHALEHRGPDGVGLYVDGAFGMVNTRLAIVDLVGGDQPIGDESGRFWVVQNGEIYNAPELRAELSARGRRFATRSDTEVLVQAFAEWGAACLDRFNGPFACAIWDRDTQELFLARDRLGVRPLFFAEVEGALLFGSECKALLCEPRVRRGLDPLGLVEALTLWSIGPDRSAFRGIRELPAGHAMVLGPDGARRMWRWWDVQFAARGEGRDGSTAALADELGALLTDATRLRLRADVPVGAYLSGGLDSSAIAAIVRRETDQPVHCLGLQFQDPRFDERTFQQRAAAALRLPLEVVEVDAHAIAAAFPTVIRYAEMPLLRTAPAPMLLLSRRARELGLKVVLSGEGADEVFAGYDIFREDKVRRFWARQPDSRARPQLLGRLYPWLAADIARAGAFWQAFFARDLTRVGDQLYSHRLRFANGARVVQVLDAGVREAAQAEGDPEARLVASLPADFGAATALGRAQYLELRTFLQGYLLHAQGDRVAMANGVEVRCPFLDYRLVEFAASLRDGHRLRGLREKYLLRRAVAPLLPAEIVVRQKRPYRAPILHAFLGAGAPSWVADALSPASLRASGLVDARRTAALVGKCQQNLESGASEVDEMALVAALSLVLLHAQFLSSPPSRALATPTRFVRGDRLASPAETRSLGETT